MNTQSLAAPLRQAAALPDHACWLVLVSALDLMLTATIIARFGGREVNGIAQRVIDLGGLPGLIVFKFAVVIAVIAIWEFIARRQPHTARRLAEWGVALSAMPVVLGLAQIAAGVMAGRLPVAT